MRGILFLCGENACRSQMAEGLAREMLSGRLRAFSAGSRPRGSVDPRAIAAMREIGIDIGDQRSKSIEEVAPEAIDLVITVCEDDEECPLFPGEVRRLQWSIPDPAAVTGTPDEVSAAFRSVRDDLARRIRALTPILTA